MRWLFVIGLALDLAGATLIASTIYSQTSAETREEAHTRWGGNFWVLLFRLREQAYVRWIGSTPTPLRTGRQLLGDGIDRPTPTTVAPLTGEEVRPIIVTNGTMDGTLNGRTAISMTSIRSDLRGGVSA